MLEVENTFPKVVKKRRKILATRILLKSVVYAFAIFGILFILLLMSVLGLLRQESGVVAKLPNSAILQVDFDKKYAETRGDTFLTEFNESSPLAFYDVIKAINMAALDPKIKTISAKVSNSSLGLAQIQELRLAIKIFRASGKKAYIFSTGFGAFGNGTSEYYLASAFDEIWMQPNTEAGITGLGIEIPFFRNVLNKIGVQPEFYTRYEYKTAVASMMDEKMSEPFRQEIERLGGSILGQIVQDVSTARNIEAKKVQSLINRAPLFAQEAKDAKLIDKIAYAQDLDEFLKTEYKADFVKFDDYAFTLKDGHSGLKTIAVLVVNGVIDEGKSIDNPLNGETVVGSATILQQLNEIAKNKDVKGLILRVNSPGGSYTASNEIWYALEKLKNDKKISIVVSMGDYAASGGYFIALAGDKIFAEPSTITGSIGVLGGKMVLAGLWDKVGINWQTINFGDNAGILSANHSFSEREKTIFNKSLDNIYKDFTLKVSQARKIDASAMDKVARGRVWTGEGALKNGLIDSIGGLDAALAEVKERADIKNGEKFSLLYYPKQKTLQEKIGEILNSSPMATVNSLKINLGLDIKQLNMLKRLNYNLVLVPMLFDY